MFGLTFEKLLLIGVIAAFIIGPDRLPAAAEKLRDLVRWARGFAGGAKERLREEMGDEFDEVDWRKLDPRQYDPRRIIREALLEDEPSPPAGASTTAATPARPEPASETGLRGGAASGAVVAGPALAASLAGPATATAAAPNDPSDSLADLPTPFDPEAT